MGERRFKLVLLGSMGVGKTCLTERFAKGAFGDDHVPTIGATYVTKRATLEGDKRFIFEIWDTAGQERYEAMTPLYYRSAEAAIIVFDLTLTESFHKAKFWLSRLRQARPSPDMPIALVGNKMDCPERETKIEEVLEFARSNGLEYFETSARTGQNVDEMFAFLALALPPLQKIEEDEVFFLVSQKRKKSFLCC